MFPGNKPLLLAAIVAALSLTACGGGEQRQLIQNKGSDTLVNVAQSWAETYQTVDPSVVVAVSGGGSGTGIAALINGTVDIANASREIKEEEIELARKGGHEPVEHTIGFDALAVYLHADNHVFEISCCCALSKPVATMVTEIASPKDSSSPTPIIIFTSDFASA